MKNYQNFTQNDLAFQNRILQSINGTAFIASTPYLTLVGAGTVRMVFQNPASTNTVVIHTMAAYNDNTVALSASKSIQGTIIFNPSAGLPTTAMNLVPQNTAAPNTTVVTAFCDTAVQATAIATAGKVTYPIAIPVGVRTVFAEEAITLTPGQNVAINLAIQGVGGGLFKAYTTIIVISR